MTAVLGRMATYSGKIVKWDDAVVRCARPLDLRTTTGIRSRQSCPTKREPTRRDARPIRTLPGSLTVDATLTR